MVTSFRYLGRLLDMTYDYFPSVIVNLQKAWRSWNCISRLMGREGADSHTPGQFYPTIVQAVFIFDVATWLVTPFVIMALEGFLHRVSRWILGKKPQQWAYCSWAYSPLEESMQVVVLE